MIELLDNFKVEELNGMHQCIISGMLEPSIGADVDEIYKEK